jgi:hypothetical protein
MIPKLIRRPGRLAGRFLAFLRWRKKALPREPHHGSDLHKIVP